MMEEHLMVLKLLIERGKTDVFLRYNTNLSNLTYKGIDILDEYWSKFSNVEINASIDHIDEKAEYIRTGTNWKHVEENLKRVVARRSSGFRVKLTVTISAYNVLDLPQIYERMQQIGVVKPTAELERDFTFWLNLVFEPDNACIKNLPDAAKEAVRARIGSDIRFNELLGLLDQPSNPSVIEMFKRLTKQVDSVREIKIDQVLPELWSFYA